MSLFASGSSDTLSRQMVQATPLPQSLSMKVDFASLFATAASLAEASVFITEALIKMLSIAQEEPDANKLMHPC